MKENWEINWKDYYKILQVHPTAEQEVIKAAYDKLARKYHPDTNKTPTANQRMKDINEAYEILSNIEKRRQYHKAWLQTTHIGGDNSDRYTSPKSESTNKETSADSSSKGQTSAPNANRHVFPTWAKWVIGLAIAWFIFIIAIPNLTSFINKSSSNTPSTTGVNNLPNVEIQSVTIPSNPIVSSGDLVYANTIRIKNDESTDKTVTWQGYSSITGKFDSGSITIPRKSYRDIIKYYIYITGGIENITYTIYYNGIVLNTWFGTHNISYPTTSVATSPTTIPTLTSIPTTAPTTIR